MREISRAWRGLTNGLPSILGLEEAIQALSCLLVGEVFATLQGFLAQFDSFEKAGFFREVAADRFLGERVGVAAPLGGQFCELVLLFGG